MKKIILSIMAVPALFLLFLCGCKANYPVSQESGKEDIAYLIFVSASNSGRKVVDVDLDGVTSFRAETVKSKKANRRGTCYSVQTGKRKITVKRDGTTLYEKYVFLSPQETKVITLP